MDPPEKRKPKNTKKQKINRSIHMKTTKTHLLLFLLWGFALTAMAQTEWHNPMEASVPYIGGRAWNAEIGNQSFNRMPDRFQSIMPQHIWNLQKQCAGLSVRFVSNSKNITVRYGLAFNADGSRNMAPLNHSGVDLYGKTADGDYHWIGTHMSWKWKSSNIDTISMRWERLAPPSSKNRGIEYVLYLPSYNALKYIEIGVDKGAWFQFLHESTERPVVVYGSSIIQGASPSRPGLMITNLVQRELGYPIINLGFSGSARMEAPLFDAMSEINARAFILDPMPNSFRLHRDTIINRIKQGVYKLRSKSEAPILLVEAHGTADKVFRADVEAMYQKGDAHLQEAYQQLLAEGVKGLYYLPHSELEMQDNDMIEGSHPNDLGNRVYADAYKKKLREMLPEDEGNRRYPPITQRRDGCYEWMARHNAVIDLNHTTNPEILLIGNSITHFWGGNPQMGVNNGGAAWSKTFGKRKVTNMGFGWDRIENVFWRIYHGELEGCAPKHICLLIGINNYADKPEDIAQGIADLATLIRKRQPQAKLHVIKIYPARNREEKVAQINQLLEKKLVCDANTDLLDFNESLLLPDGSGKIDPQFFGKDGLHPNEKGYTVIGKQLKKHLK